MEKLSPYTALRRAAEGETIRLRKGKGRLGKVGHAFNPAKAVLREFQASQGHIVRLHGNKAFCLVGFVFFFFFGGGCV